MSRPTICLDVIAVQDRLAVGVGLVVAAATNTLAMGTLSSTLPCNRASSSAAA